MIFNNLKSFVDNIYTDKISIDEVEEDQCNLLENMVEFNNKSRPKNKEGKAKKRNTFDSVNAHYEGRELTFESGIFSIKSTQGKGLKILTPKQMLQIFPIALAQVKAGNTSENLLNEIRQIIYFCIKQKKLLKGM